MMTAKLPQKLLLASCLAVAAVSGLTACEKKPETPMEKVEDGIKDSLDMRPNEAMKDTGEDLKDAAQNAGEAIKEGAAEVKQEVKEATDGK